jgi:hypothetical protein
MEDKLKRYEKVEFLGEGQVIKKRNMLHLLRRGYIMKPLKHFNFIKYIYYHYVVLA